MITKNCIQCGKEFTCSKNGVRFCSHSCAAKSRKSEAAFERAFNEKYAGKFVYHSEYKGADSAFKCQCVTCGTIIERNAQCIRRDKYLSECAVCVNKRKAKQQQEEAECKNKRAQIKRMCFIRDREIIRNIRLIRACAECGKVFKANSQNQKYCSLKCRKQTENRRAEITERRKIKENGKINWGITLDKLIERDNGVCHICGEMVVRGINYNAPNYPTIDHVMPISKGGTHTWDNVKLAHRKCNIKKRDTLLHEQTSGQIKMYV